MFSRITVRQVQLGTACSAVIVAVGLFFVYQSIVGSKVDEHRKIKFTVTKLQEQNGIIAAEQKKLDELKNRVNSNLENMINNNQKGSVLAQISNELDELKVSNREVKTHTAKSFYDFTYTPLTIRFESDFNSTYQLLQRLSQYDQSIRIQKLEMTQTKNVHSRVLENELELFVFSKSQKETQP